MKFFAQPTLADKVGAAVYGVGHRGGPADVLMWPFCRTPPGDAPAWAAGLPPYESPQVNAAALKLLCYTLQELVKTLPPEACQRIWEAHGRFLGIDPDDPAQLAGYACVPAGTPPLER